MLSRPQARSSLERSGISWSPLWKCVRTFVDEFETSPFAFWAEGSNEGPSTQHFRSNLHPIYQSPAHMYMYICGPSMPLLPVVELPDANPQAASILPRITRATI